MPTMANLKLGGRVHDPDFPEYDTDGELLYGVTCGDKVNRLKTPGQFIRLCALVVGQKQYAKFRSPWDGPNSPRYFVVDMQTANAVYSRWKVMTFGQRRKLLKAVKNMGPIHVLCVFARPR
jgi:hypothetical protein